MCLPLILAALLISVPAAAQIIPPDTDEANCVALAERMDATAAAKQPVAAADKEQFAECIGLFNCHELAAAANAGEVPREALSTNAKAMHYTMRTCGNTSEAVQEPTDPKKTAPGGVFGQEPKSEFQ